MSDLEKILEIINDNDDGHFTLEAIKTFGLSIDFDEDGNIISYGLDS